jgi:hypothetical protein
MAATYEAECVPGSGGTPPWLLCSRRGYDIYDYRDPGELRIDAQAEAMITGHIKTGAVSQDVVGGGELVSAQCATARDAACECAG